MYKLVAIDLDGTLLNSYGAVSARTKATIQEAIDRGVQIVIASRKNNRFNKDFFKRTGN